MIRNRLAVLVVFSALLRAAGTDAAPMVPVDQDRSLFALAEASDDGCAHDTDSNSVSAPDFGVFDEQIFSYIEVCGGVGAADASQNSEISSTFVNATGWAHAEGYGVTLGGHGGGIASSSLEFTFTLSAPTAVIFDVWLMATDSGEVSSSLYSGGVPVAEHAVSGPFGSVSESHDLTLPAGMYTLRADAQGAADGDVFFAGNANGLFVIGLTVQDNCAGDLDGDCDVDQADLGILLACYGVSDCGDLDGDGDTDQADLGILLANYGASG